MVDNTLEEQIKKMDRDRSSRPMVAERIKYARDIASAIAELHQVDHHGIARFSHHDLKPGNVVLVNGTIKLNDFNDAEVLLYNTTDKEECRFRRPKWGVYGKAAEEVRELPLTHKVDIHSLGVILYSLMVRSVDYTIPGRRLPAVLRTNDKRTRTVLNLILQCWSTQPDMRPSALHVAEELSRVLLEM